MQSRKPEPSYFLYGLLFLCLSYFGFELFFNSYAMFSVDELWFAHSIYHYKDNLPYRDFPPYKTILGYYILLLPMLFTHGVIHTLVIMKNAFALLNTAIFLGASVWLERYFARCGILISLALLVFAEVVLCYSTIIRVDLLAYWFCLFSLLSLLDRRYCVAGIFIGLGFITSQKVLWYVIASNTALGMYWLLLARNRKTLGNIFQFNFFAVVVLGIYIAAWSYVAGLHTVTNSVFTEAAAIYQLDWYNSYRKLYWGITLLYNPMLFLLWPFTLVSLMVTYPNDTSYHQRFLIVFYALTMLACLLPYKQVFPYYMQITLPILLVLYAAFFTWLIGLFQSPQQLKILTRKLWLCCYSVLFTAAAAYTVLAFKLPVAYLLICIIPIFLPVYIIKNQTISKPHTTCIYNIIAVSIIFTGVIYPLSFLTAKLISMNGAYQRANINAANSLLQDGNSYVAGVDLIYNKSQSIAGLRHLMIPVIDFLNTKSDKIRPVMLASLDEDPTATSESVVTALKQSQVKFYVNNYRMMALPETIKQFLDSEYEHLWGSIYLYAPSVPAGHNSILIKFTGVYLIESNVSNLITLNGKRHHSNSLIHLERGKQTSIANKPYRLKLIPDTHDMHLNPKFEDDNWQLITF